MAANRSYSPEISPPAFGRTRTIELRHELGADLSSAPQEETIVVFPSMHPIHVTAKSSVEGRTAQRMRSENYVGIVRRRRIQKISDQIQQLVQYQERADFHTYTFPIFDEVRAAIRTLSDSEEFEGNSVAVLRQIRSTLLDRGWENYRIAKKRQAAIGALFPLASNERVEPEDVNAAFRLLYEHKMSPSLPIPLTDYDECENDDESQQAKTTG